MDFKPQQTPPRRPEDTFGAQPNPDNEPETYVTPEGQPTTLGDAHAEPQAQPVAVTKKKTGAKKWLVGGVVVLLLAGLGALAYWQWADAQNARNEVASLKTSLEAAEKEAKEETTKDDDGTAPAVTPLSDSELVTTEAEAFLDSTDNNSYVFTASNVKTEDTFAVVKAGIPNTGANPKYVVLEKSDGNWVVIYSVVGPIPTAEKDRLTTEFGVPKTLLAE